MRRKYKPIEIGDKFGQGRLEVIAEAPPRVQPSGQHARRWKVRCACGSAVVVRDAHLKTGHTTSCGCRCREVAVENGRRTATHGQSRSLEWSTWHNMKGRCSNANHRSFANYGGRGVIVCAEWLHDFPAFLAHVGPRPSPSHSLDRIDNERGYEPGNVRWSTRSEQQRNKRGNNTLTAFGETMCVAAWAERIGLRHSTIRRRLDAGWVAEDALTRPSVRAKVFV